jgi:hypothetical protein
MIVPGAMTSRMRIRRTVTSTCSSHPGWLRQSSRTSLSGSSPLRSGGPASVNAIPSKRSRFAAFQ